MASRLPAMGIVRSLVVVFGALVILQSSSALDLPKLVFLAAVGASLLGAIRQVFLRRRTPIVRAARRWLIVSIATFAAVGISFPIAVAYGTPLSAWIRDAATYGLLASAPWLAIDLGLSASRRTCLLLIGVAGGLATVSFWVSWIERRGLADLPIDRLVLPSFSLAVALFAVGVALAAGSGRARYVGAAIASATIWLLLSTGTRSTLVILVVPLVVLTATAYHAGRGVALRGVIPILAPIVVAATIVLSAVVVAPSGLGQVSSTPAPLESPIGTGAGQSSSPGPATPGATDGTSIPTANASPAQIPSASPTAVPSPSATNPLTGRFESVDGVLSGRDASLRERIAQWQAAWDLFAAAPLLGNGLGVAIAWVDSSGALVERFTADTPLVILAKLGLMGFVLTAAMVWATIGTIRMLRPEAEGTREARMIILAFGAAVVALAPLGAQIEDKGTSLAVILLLGFALASMREAATSDQPSPATAPRKSGA